MHMNKTHVSYLNRLFTTNGDSQLDKGTFFILKIWKIFLLYSVNGTTLSEFEFPYETSSSLVIEQPVHANGKN